MLKWYGERLKKTMAGASKRAINEIMGECVTEAQSRVPPGELHDDIQILEPATRRGSGYVGSWGIKDVWYGWIVEKGSRARVVEAQTKQALYWPGATHPVGKVSIPDIPARPFLTPAMDIHYPELPGRIRKYL